MQSIISKHNYSYVPLVPVVPVIPGSLGSNGSSGSSRTPEYCIGTNTQILHELSPNSLFDIL